MDKLNTLLIFTIKLGDKIKNFSKNSFVLSNKSLIYVNHKAWDTYSIIKILFYKILNYFKKLIIFIKIWFILS